MICVEARGIVLRTAVVNEPVLSGGLRGEVSAVDVDGVRGRCGRNGQQRHRKTDCQSKQQVHPT
jgi:hypothetical protein